MRPIFKHIPLYRFLKYCQETGMEKTILDCGAGGDEPPLSLFADYGYATTGIEYDLAQIELAETFARERGQSLNIHQGDMRRLNFADDAFGFVYTYNSVFHMLKRDVACSIAEMRRVLRPGGLFFANFLTVHDFRCGIGTSFGDLQYEQMEDGKPTLHSYYEPDEPDGLFAGMEILYKENRVLEREYEGEMIRQGFVDYIARK